MTGNYDDIPYPPDYGAPHAMTPTPIPALDLDGPKADAFEQLSLTAIMLETWAPECFPEVNEKGQKHFARVMMESAADAINAALASFRTQLAEANARADKAEQDTADAYLSVIKTLEVKVFDAEKDRDRFRDAAETCNDQALAARAELKAVKAERDMWAAVSGEWEKQMGQFRPGRVTDDALFEANRAIAKERDEFRSECVANLKDESDKPELGARDYAEQWAQDTLSGRADGNKFPWGQRNIARAFINMTTELSTYRALIEKAVEALGPILSFVEDLDASALSLTEQEMRPKFIRRARETLAALTAAIGKGEGT